jgi:hypothetical protein
VQRREKKMGNKLKISSLEGKFITVVLQCPWYKTHLKKLGSETGKHNFVSMGFGLPLTGAQDTDQGTKLWWPKLYAAYFSSGISTLFGDSLDFCTNSKFTAKRF